MKDLTDLTRDDVGKILQLPFLPEFEDSSVECDPHSDCIHDIMRDSMLNLIEKADLGLSGRGKIGYYLAGPGGCGKSVALHILARYCYSLGLFVVYVPSEPRNPQKFLRINRSRIPEEWKKSIDIGISEDCSLQESGELDCWWREKLSRLRILFDLH